MNNHDRAARDGAAACLELAAKRGGLALESAWNRFTPRQRRLVPAEFLRQLRREAAIRADGIGALTEKEI